MNLEIDYGISAYQVLIMGGTAFAWVYAWGKTHQLFTSLLNRVEKIDDKVEKLDHLFKLTPEKAMRYLHTHSGCKTILQG